MWKRAAGLCVGIEERGRDLRRRVMIGWLEREDAAPVRAFSGALRPWIPRREIGEEPICLRVTVTARGGLGARQGAPPIVIGDIRERRVATRHAPCENQRRTSGDHPHEFREHGRFDQAASAGTRRALEPRRVGWIGSTIVNAVPTPGVLSQLMVPPWASTIDLAIARPSPDPFVEAER